MSQTLTASELEALLDPQVAAALRGAPAGGTPPHLLTPAQVRAAWEAARTPLVRPAHDLQITDMRLDTPASALEARLYRPAAPAADTLLPGMVYFHGGGFTNGDLDSQDPTCCAMAERAVCVVLSINYRKLPAHPFPAAFDDAVAAVRWLARHAPRCGIDGGRIGTGGDSSGANLALAAALALRAEVPLKALWLAYPIIGNDFNTASYIENAAAPLLTRERCQRILRDYLGADPAGADWRAAPLLADDFDGLPAAVVIAAQLDPLRSDAEIFADRLTATGVRAVRIDARGMPHAFLRWINGGCAAQAYVTQSLQTLRELLRS